MKRSPLLIGLLVVAVLLIGWLWTGYNSLIGAKGAVDGNWAQVETQYQRRFDLVPNLTRTVQGAANFEQETLTQVTAARTQWQQADQSGNRGDQIAAAQGFDSALSRLLVTVEAYPQLKATEAFRDLMTQLEGTENRITVERMRFNEASQSFNTLRRTFPNVVIARFMGFAEKAYFKANEGSEKAPEVKF